MRKIAPIAAIALFAVAFTSCKKDYTCSCTTGQGVKTDYPYGKAKKSDAKKACDASNTVWAMGGGSCSLK